MTSKIFNLFGCCNSPRVVEPREEESYIQTEGLFPNLDKSQGFFNKKIFLVTADILRAGVLNVQFAGFCLELFGLTVKSCSLADDPMIAEVIPYLTSVVAPISLVLAIHRSYCRLKLLITALRAHDFVSAVFFSFQITDSLGSVFASISKTFFGGVRFLGINHNEVLSLISSLVVPIIMIIVGAVGMVSDTWALGRNIQDCTKFHDKQKGYDHKIQNLLETVNYLQGPSQTLPRNELSSSEYKTAFKKIQSNRSRFKESHSTTDRRYAAQQKKLKEFMENQSLDNAIPLLKLLNDHIQRMNLPDCEGELKPILQELSVISNNMDTLLQNQEIVLIQRLTFLFKKIESFVEIENSSIPLQTQFLLKNLVQEYNQELQDMNQEIHNALLLVGISKGEIHRKIFYRLISIFVSAMVMTAGILLLIGPHKYLFPATIISLSSSAINLTKFIFDKSLYQENLGKIEEFLAYLHRNSLQLEGLS